MENQKSLPTCNQVKNLFGKLGLLPCEGETFDGFTLDGENIVLESSTWYSGCGEDTFCDEYLITDVLSLPVEEIIEERKKADEVKKQKEIDAKIERDKKDEIQREQKERAKLAQLKAKYEN